MKTSSTVHLEDSTWKEINDYAELYGCSRNEAIERMFTERRLLISMNEKTANNTHDSETQNDDIVSNSIKNTFANMPD